MIFEIKNVLTERKIKKLYDDLLGSRSWHLKSTYGDGSNPYPNLPVTFDHNPLNPHWHSYFQGLYHGINSMLYQQYAFDLGDLEPSTISINAQKKGHHYVFHDHQNYRYVIVGFLTPEWEEEWGGELQVEGETIKFKPGNFILFKGDKLHDAMIIKNEIPYWRISVGIFIK